MIRASGIIMPVFSLPGKYGIGTFGREAYEFVDFLRSAGQKYWQVLPMGPTDCGNSPYSSLSVFAGNPLFIDLEELAGEGLLDADRLRMAGWGNGDVDYDKVIFLKNRFLRQAFERGYEEVRADVNDFSARNGWVWDFGLYMALKNYFGGRPWYEWDEDIRLRESSAVMRYASELKTEINYHIYVQYLFFKQWDKLKKYAEKNGITFIGDIPIYAAMDSADVWATPENFQLDKDGRPSAVAGVPPDYFSATGQRWGNPIYDWDYLKDHEYQFWIDRIGYNQKLFDIIRIDHFRAFDTFWKIPASCPTAIEGEWIEAPGYEVIDTLRAKIDGLNLVAEDLGELRPEVLQLKDHYHLKGMKILVFSIETGGKYAYDSFHDVENMIIYTGTHDNDTLMQWYEGLSVAARRKVRRFLKREGIKQGSVKDRLLTYTLRSKAEYAILPMADLLGLGAEGHINTPGTVGSPNWEWRMPDFGQAKEELRKYRRAMTERV